MQRPKYVAFLFLLGAVLLGYALGFAADRASVRDRLAPRWDQRAMRDQLHDALGLDDGQRALVDSILDRRNQRIETLMAPIKPQIDAVKDSARAQIRLRLTPAQQARWDDIIRAIDADRKR
ncbi:MAG: hypothetical protein ACJ79S_03965 [Gemmatimonadaceae bacterium]